ncbi:MAG: hypothetical protein HND43_07540 [Armatimonadetes bacterium]|nr:hypothetical protein [Armatimonadota bacterium]NOG39231.1 hypothetical protein [Armatimonadota bacterium]GIK33277.1 MAG: hypothetical protein BroJett009_22690 [Armatimonadota bacterium]
MPWQKFTEGSRSFAPKVTITANGAILFNQGACERFHLESVEGVVLYFDDETRRIGFELLADLNAEGVRRLRKRRMGASIAAKPFLDKFDIHPGATMFYELRKDDESGFLVADLGAGRSRKKSTRGKKVVDNEAGA